MILTAGQAAAKQLTLGELLAKMEQTDKTVMSLQFDFQQEIVYNLTNEKNVNTGKVSYLKPDNILMQQKSPLEQTIIANGTKVWIYTPKYNQVIVDSWKKWVSNSMVPISVINFGKEWKDLKNRYVISNDGMEGLNYALMFTPKDKAEYKMRFIIDADSFIPVKVTILGNNVTITTEIKSKLINPKLDKGMFNFKAPQGVEVMNLP
jgi:outer membrane lipoprotein carrier protein